MADNQQDPGTGTDGGQKTGTENEKKLDLSALDGLDDAALEQAIKDNPKLAKFMQSQSDKRVTEANKKFEQQAKERERLAEEKARKKAEESKLIEDGKLKELAELREKEAAEAKAKLAAYEHRETVGKLLDKKGIADPEDREFFQKFGGELAELDAHLDAYKARFEKAVETEVVKRLGTQQPGKGKPADGKPSLDLDPRKATPAEKAAYIGAHGYEAWQKLVDKAGKAAA